MINNNVLVSIVMPAFNAEKTIEASIRSVLGQTYKNWELIIIDDCSEDKTMDVVMRLQAEDTRVHHIKNPQNSGVSYSRNIGIQQAEAEWIAFLDSDDLWESQKLEKQIDVINAEGDIALVFTGSSFIKGDKEKSTYILHVPSRVNYRQLLKQNVISCSSVLVQKELLLKYPMQKDEMHEDFAVWLQILKQGYSAYGVDQPLLIYRLSTNSKSSNKKKAVLMTYKVYRHVGLYFVEALYYLLWYSVKSMKKYRAISNGFK